MTVLVGVRGQRCHVMDLGGVHFPGHMLDPSLMPAGVVALSVVEVQGMVVPAGGTVLAPTVLEEKYTVGFFGPLRQQLDAVPTVPKHLRSVVLSRHAQDDRVAVHDRGRAERRLRRMVELACLSEFAGTVLHVVLTNGLVRADWKQRFCGIKRSLHASPALDVGGVVVLARGSIFTTSGT